jgi:4-alpha-glucanotransferase
MRVDGYSWWMKRLEGNFGIFDIVRLDHFRAFHNYWRVPAAAPRPKNGRVAPRAGLGVLQRA